MTLSSAPLCALPHGLRVTARDSSRILPRTFGKRAVLGLILDILCRGEVGDAKDGTYLWAERYDRAIDDIFAIQDEITLVLATKCRSN